MMSIMTDMMYYNTTKNDVDRYLKELKKVPLLTAEEEKDLFIQYKKKKSNAAAKRLVESNMRYVVKIAYEYNWASRKGPISLLDLIQEGALGLMHAITRFDHTRGYRLVQYALWWIKVYIRTYIRRYINAVTGPDRREDRSKSLTHHNNNVVSMHKPIMGSDSEGDAVYLEDLMSVEPPQFEHAAKHDAFMAITEALCKLNPRERDVIKQYYFSDEQPTYKQIGKKWKVSRERIRQNHDLALAYLSEDLKDYKDFC